jgi:Spy/CpxP family protein refolding chaperone
MNGAALKSVLVLSLLLNLGVIGAVVYRASQNGEWPAIVRAEKGAGNLPDYLELTADQRRKWREIETGFLGELKGEWQKIRDHRETMIREIFSGQPDRARIEAERSAIAELQSAQQRRIIEQLLRERDLLDAEQRRKLADLLLRQAPASTFEERLHGK